MKAYHYFLALGVAITVWADLVASDVLRVAHGVIPVALVLAAGLAWGFTAGFAPRKILGIPTIVSACHTILWFIASAVDTRTFFGGAMMPVMSFWAWLLVTVLVGILSMARNLALRSGRNKQT